jgi:hypothetical protein
LTRRTEDHGCSEEEDVAVEHPGAALAVEGLGAEARAVLEPGVP